MGTPLMVFCISAIFVVTSPFSFLILFTWGFSLFFLVILARGLSILLTFSKNHLLVLFIYLFICVLSYFRATPTVYGGSQARDLIGAIAAGLHQSHSNAISEPCLQPASQLTAMPDP